MGRLILALVVSILFSTSICLARTWYVPSAECPTIQAGIDSAGAGDTVLVAAGAYTGVGSKNLDFGGTDLVLLSEAGPEHTIIDCEGSGRGFWFHSVETGAAVVQGFTVTNGNIAGGFGGGMLCDASSPTVRSCILSGNIASVGGGMFCDNTSSPTISSCTFMGDSAGWGGGMSCRFGSSPTVSGCTFIGNSAGFGGGMFCKYGSSPTVSGCTFIGNSAGWGGGMFCASPSSPTVSSCTFIGNSASWGGGMFCDDESSELLIENTIIAFSPAGKAVWCEGGSCATLTCCDIYGNAGGDYVGCIADQLGINGNFSACPSFCDAEGGDFQLCDESPCAPGNHPDGYECGLIGAWDVGCVCGPSATEGSTWGAIKAMYR